MEYYGLIYEGILNGKPYVGQHINSPDYSLEDRWNAHLCPSSGCRYFRNAIQHYGRDNVEWNIICYCISGGQEHLDDLEIYFIKERNALVPNGYNLTEGGRGGVPSEEMRKLMSESAKKRCENPDELARMRAQSLRLANDPENRKKMSERLKKFHEENPDARKEQGENLRKYYEDNPDARQRQSDTTKQYYQENPDAGKEHGEKMKKYYEDNPDARQRHIDIHKKRHQDNPNIGREHSIRMKKYYEENTSASNKKVHQYSKDGKTFIKEWASARDAHRGLGIGFSGICGVCKEYPNTKSAGGFFWRYAPTE